MPESADILLSTPFGTEELLKVLGFPEDQLSGKGSLTWQEYPHPAREENAEDVSLRDPLPITASLVVHDKFIRIKVFNIDPSAKLRPHLVAEWNISHGYPELKKYSFGQGPNSNLMHLAQGPEAIKNIRELASAFGELIPIFTNPAEVEMSGERKSHVRRRAQSDA